MNLSIAKFDCMHILGMELTPHKGHLKISGFHHDYLGQLEKSGIVRLKIIDRYSEGFYKAQVWVADTIAHPPKTFFPQSWTREEVIKRIINRHQACMQKIATKQADSRRKLCSWNQLVLFFIGFMS